MGRELVDEIITLIHSESNNNPAPKHCKIVKTYGGEPYCDVEVENLGILIHKKVIGTSKIGSDGIVCFLNGDLDDVVIISQTIIEEIDLSPIFNALSELNGNKSDINHTHSQYLTEHQDLSNYAIKNEVEEYLNQKVNLNNLIDLIYPVGSIYMSVNNVNPSVLFGGIWEPIKDRFLLAKGNDYVNGATGGESSHTLNINEMPSHTHIQNAHKHTQAQHRHKEASKYSNGSGSAGAYTHSSNRTAIDHYTDYQTPAINETTATNQNTGGGQAHNNMPPYLVVNIWKRVAYYYYNASTINWNVTSVSNNIGRKCYKNIYSLPDSEYITVECIVNIASIGKWFSSGLCLTQGIPADNTTTSTENYGKKVIVGIYSSDSYTDNATIKGSGGVNLDKNTDYLLKFILKDKKYFSWEISDLNNNLLSSGTLESDVSSYTHLSYSTFEGVNVSIREFKVYERD